MSRFKFKKYLRKALKWVAWSIASFVLLFLMVALALQFSSVQTYLIQKITSSIGDKTETRIEIERIAIRFPKTLGLKGIYAEDTQGDTLLYAGSIFVDIGMFGLLRNQVNVNKLELEGVTANMKREAPDSVYNYQFLIDAFDTGAEKDTVQETDEEKKTWEIHVDRVLLKDISYHMVDHFSGFELQAYLEEFSTRLRNADILQQKFHAENMALTGPRVHIFLTPASVTPPVDTTSSGILDLAANSILLQNAEFSLTSFDGSFMDINASKLEIEPQSILLHENLLALKTVNIDGVEADFLQPAKENQNNEMAPQVIRKDHNEFYFEFAEILDWTISVENLDISKTSFRMNQDENKLNPFLFNPQNISLTDITLSANDIHVSPDLIQIKLEDASMNFSEQFQLKKLAVNLDIGATTQIDNLIVQTGESNLGISFFSQESFLRFSQEEILNYPMQLSIAESHISKDLSFFIPDLQKYYFNWPGNKGLNLGGMLTGNLDDMHIDSLWVTGPDFFHVFVEGHVKGLPNVDSLYADLPMVRMVLAPRKIAVNLPDTLQPQGMDLPRLLYIDNRSKGSLDAFNTRLEMRSDLGNLFLTAQLRDSMNTPARFKGKLFTESFDIGKLLKQTETISQPLSLYLDLEGEGIKPQDLQLDAQVRLANLMLLDYAYDEWLFNLSLKDSVASLATNYQDDNLSMSLDGSYGIFAQNPSIKSNLDIKYALLNELGLMTNDFLLRTQLEAEMVFDVEDFFNGHVVIHQTSIATEGDIYELPEFKLTSLSELGDYTINLSSRFVSADFKGNFTPIQLQPILSEHFSHYYGQQSSDQDGDTLGINQFELNLHILPDEFITSVLLSDLDSFDTLKLDISYDSRIRELMLELGVPSINYSHIEITQLHALIVSDIRIMEFEVDCERLNYQDVELFDFALIGNIVDKTVTFALTLQDPENNPLYAARGGLARVDTLYRLHLHEEELLINGEYWNIPTDNSITFGTQYIDVHNFTIESQGRMLSVANRQQEEEETGLDIQLREIDLGKLTGFSAKDYPPVGGVFEGDLSLMNIFDNMTFLADLSVENFSFQGDTIGSIELKAENPQEHLFEVFASVKSDVTDLIITGNYRTGEEVHMEIDVNLNRLDLPSFEGFTAGNLTHMAGHLSGKMKISGNMQEPVIAGELMFNETSFRVPALNAGYFLKSEKIIFDRQNVKLQNVSLEDSTGRRANLSGNINFADINQLAFNINLSSRNFLLMNLQPGQNEMYHGRVLMDSDLRLRGNQDNPSIEGRIKLNEGSTFSFTLPQRTPEAIGDEGVVEFVQFRDDQFYLMAQQTDTTHAIGSTFEVLDLSVNIEIDPQTDVRIIIDEYAGDFLLVKGGGLLSFGIDPGGRISLSGQYDISDGEYLLTFYDVVRRNFQIQSGSNLSWSGDPMDAQINITAVHTVRTSAANLMVGLGGSQAESAALRRQYPFLVYLKMNGNLMEPQISFELALPQEHQNALDGALAGRLNQINQNESELNKQVFAVLILGTFIQDNPFASMSGGGGLSATARSSVSQMLSQQLNRFSDRYVRGVDINFEVESFEDYADGQTVGRTELQMEVSRDFFDERVRVKVGGNIELEDDARREAETGEIAGDFVIEYLITPEGDLRLKGFRTKNYADIFDGQVIETGLSVLFTRSYDQFRELFTKREQQDSEMEEYNETEENTEIEEN